MGSLHPSTPLLLSIGYGFRLYRCGFEDLLSFGFVRLLLAGFEWQGLGELYDDTAQETVDVINPVHVTRTRKAGHIERTFRTVTGHAKASGKMLSVTGATIAGIACKRRRPAR